MSDTPFEKLKIQGPPGTVSGRIIWRLSVPNGWIVETSGGVCFVPDEKHEWKS